MANEKVITLTNENFDQEVVSSDSTVVVDFWAPWCGPCRAVGPVIDELANEYDGKAKIAKLNVDDAGDIAAKFKIMSIPTILIFKNSEVVEKLIGARSKSELSELIEKHI
ncbi:thioredoxin [Herbivorax sp. ANBcel31]|uniref:thioredoxin n=1 Tax=Herbivorax sp. ANBcel31 TaxID=3069754 RepID=UPI0027B6EF4A|nr:thioredoxin [Herbivorax sp. ANBcel31]MDQ2087399.1 thioredoxin [Herbivorax sp. ANBcel31]